MTLNLSFTPAARATPVCRQLEVTHRIDGGAVDPHLEVEVVPL
jgi:hypothetical protein